MKRLLVAFLLVVVSIPFMLKADKSKPRVNEVAPVLPYSYSQVLLSSPGLRSPAADLLFMNLCYLTGNDVFNRWKERKFTEEEWKRLIENVEVIEKLDPYYFDPLYYLGSYVPWKVEKNRELLLRINSILLQGNRRVKDWRLPFFVGFNYFYFLGDKVKGAKYLKLASQMKGAPSYLKLLVPRLYAESGRINLAIAVTYEELKRAKEEPVKKELKRRLKALIAMKELDRALELYRRRFGKCPSDLKELVKSGIIMSIPEDPYGGKFYIEKGKCSVWTTSNLRPVKEPTSSR